MSDPTPTQNAWWQDYDLGDILVVLGAHFDAARRNRHGDRKVDYLRDGLVAMTARFDKRGQLSSLQAGPAWRSEDRDELRLRAARTIVLDRVEVGRELLFSYVPVERAFRSADGSFQLLPPPPESPGVQEALHGKHPVVLEFVLELCGDTKVDRARRARRKQFLGLTLSSLIMHLDQPSPDGEHAWFWDTESGASRYEQIAYWHFGPAAQAVPGSRESLSPIDTFPGARVLPHAEYYDRPGISDNDEVLTVPDSLDASLMALVAMEPGRRDAFLRAAYWFQHARRIWHYSTSASYLATCQAIEALLPPAQSRNCESCRRSFEEPSITKRFNNWVETYVNNEDLRPDLYNIRSFLAHGSRILDLDWEAPALAVGPNFLTELGAIEQVWAAARSGLANWINVGGDEIDQRDQVEDDG